MTALGAFFAALGAFFALGTFGFWLLAALAFIIVTAFEENDWIVSAILTLGIFAGIVGILKPTLLSIVHHPIHSILLIAAYFAIGTA